METNLNRPISEITKEEVAKIKMISFDSDGVTVEKGTEFIENNQIRTHEVLPSMAEKLLQLKNYFLINVTSGRNMSFIKHRYDFLMGSGFSIQAEIGNFFWWGVENWIDEKWTASESQEMAAVKAELKETMSFEDNFIGFEPKRKIITVHAKAPMSSLEMTVVRHDPKEQLYCWWNDEAYDIGPKRINKGTGLRKMADILGIKMEEIMIVGNGINDKNMRDIVGIDVSTDPVALSADYVIEGEHLGGEKLVERLLELKRYTK